MRSIPALVCLLVGCVAGEAESGGEGDGKADSIGSAHMVPTITGERQNTFNNFTGRLVETGVSEVTAKTDTRMDVSGERIQYIHRDNARATFQITGDGQPVMLLYYKEFTADPWKTITLHATADRAGVRYVSNVTITTHTNIESLAALWSYDRQYDIADDAGHHMALHLTGSLQKAADGSILPGQQEHRAVFGFFAFPTTDNGWFWNHTLVGSYDYEIALDERLQ